MSWELIFLFSFLHLISALFPTFYECKSGIFRFIEDKRSLFGNWSWVSFLRISYSFKFLALLQFSLACLGVICRIYVCTSKINFQCVDFFVFFWCWYSVVFYTFVSFPVKINWFSINDIVTLRGNFFFSFLHLISTPFPTVDKREGGIFQVSRGREDSSEILLYYVYFLLSIILHFALLFILLFYLWVLFVDCIYVLEN